MNLFATVLTYAAPFANYRGEAAENRSVIQKITKGRLEYAVISSEAIRNAMREIFQKLNFPCNRERLHNEDQLAVRFQDYPDSKRFVDDFFMGWFIAVKRDDKQNADLELNPQKLVNTAQDKIASGKGHKLTRQEILACLKVNGREPNDFTFKRDSVLRVNIALALDPYRHDSLFTQSPQHVNSPWKNAENAQLLYHEVVHTAFQYPFALNLEDCRHRPDWGKAMLKAVGELHNVAGNHARSYFEMAPASILIRITPRLVAGYDTYGFESKDGKHLHPEVVNGILKGDYPGTEFFLGGKIVKDMDNAVKKALNQKKAILKNSPQRLLEIVSKRAFSA